MREILTIKKIRIMTTYLELIPKGLSEKEIYSDMKEINASLGYNFLYMGGDDILYTDYSFESIEDVERELEKADFDYSNYEISITEFTQGDV